MVDRHRQEGPRSSSANRLAARHAQAFASRARCRRELRRSTAGWSSPRRCCEDRQLHRSGDRSIDRRPSDASWRTPTWGRYSSIGDRLRRRSPTARSSNSVLLDAAARSPTSPRLDRQRSSDRDTDDHQGRRRKPRATARHARRPLPPRRSSNRGGLTRIVPTLELAWPPSRPLTSSTASTSSNDDIQVADERGYFMRDLFRRSCVRGRRHRARRDDPGQPGRPPGRRRGGAVHYHLHAERLLVPSPYGKVRVSRSTTLREVWPRPDGATLTYDLGGETESSDHCHHGVYRCCCRAWSPTGSPSLSDCTCSPISSTATTTRADELGRVVERPVRSALDPAV